jgi:hypothetical protein
MSNKHARPTPPPFTRHISRVSAFYPSFPRQQESIKPSGNPEKLDSRLRGNDVTVGGTAPRSG